MSIVRSLLAGLAAALAAWPSCVLAEDYPARAVRIVVPQSAGGATDTFARAIGQKLSERWKQPVVIENRAGAAGVIGTELVAKAPADGYTLLVTYEGSQAINPSLYEKLPFDSIRDFEPIATISVTPFLLIVGPQTKANTLAGISCPGAGQSRQAELRLGGKRLRQSSARRDAESRGRNPYHACALQGGPPGYFRCDRRPPRFRHLQVLHRSSRRFNRGWCGRWPSAAVNALQFLRTRRRLPRAVSKISTSILGGKFGRRDLVRRSSARSTPMLPRSCRSLTSL